MLKVSKLKLFIILLICILGIYFSLPTFISNHTFDKFYKYLPNSKVNLGLDLRGGASIILEVDSDKYYKDKLNNSIDIIRKNLSKNKIKIKNITINSKNSEENGVQIQLEFSDTIEIKDISSILYNALESKAIKINISSNYEKTLEILIPVSMIEESKRNLISQSIEIIRRRIDESGTKEIDIQRQGINQILLQVPGVNDTSEIKRLLGQTAKLTFHYVADSNSSFLETKILRYKDSKFDSKGSNFEKNSQILNSEIENYATIGVISKPAMSGEMLADARASINDGQSVVAFKLTSLGSKIFAEITSKNIGKQLAIVLDEEVISAPVINQAIIGGSGVISGNFNPESANELAILLRAGALPAPLVIVEERTVGPTLGQESIDAGSSAIIIASLAIMVFMIIFYSFWGIFANIGLIFNVIIMIAVLGTIGATLTLPGLAGIALTLGMAVDANVLIYERMREEYKKGITTLKAIESGYKISFATILDSNITTIVAAVILYIFGHGPVKGFAVTLIVGILCSLFTSVSLTKALVSLFYRTMKIEKLGL